MSPKSRPQLARRVVTGVNADGRSIICSDGETPTWVRRPTGSVIMDIWRADTVPADPAHEPAETSDEVLAPPTVGLCVRMAVFPPDGSIDPEAAAAYETAMRGIYGDQGSATTQHVPGMHRTDTVDIVTVVDGEIWLVMEDGETLLRTGDSVVQRATPHAWQNRSGVPCTLISTMIAAAGS